MFDSFFKLAVENNDTESWRIVVNFCKKKSCPEARLIFEKTLQLFPTYVRIWTEYISFELSSNAMDNCELLFERCLLKIPNLEIWKLYIAYIKKKNMQNPEKEFIICDAYEYALDIIGSDYLSMPFWLDYIEVLKERPLTQTFTNNTKIQSIRRAFHRMLQLPLHNLEIAWKEYCNYENLVNKNLAIKLIDELSKSYTSMRSVARELETYTKGLSKSHPPIPYSAKSNHLKLLNIWFEYLKYEESNPISLDNKSLLIQRIVLCYEQALLIFPKWPQVWLGYINFLINFVELNIETSAMTEMINNIKIQIANIFQRATEIYIPDSQIMYLAWAKFEEEFGTQYNVDFVFSKCLSSPLILDQILIYIQKMNYVKKIEGFDKSQEVFNAAIDDQRCGFEIYFAAALLQSQTSIESSIKTLDLGLKNYQNSPEYIKAYIDFFTSNKYCHEYRSSFEKILSLEITQRDINLANYIIEKYLIADNLFGSLNSFRALFKRIFMFKSSLSNNSIVQDQDFSNSLNLYFRFMSKNPLKDPMPDQSSDISTPDTSQMMPFNPKPLNFIETLFDPVHPVSGGRITLPSTFESLIAELPPKNSFTGPTVKIDEFLETILNLPDVIKIKEKNENDEDLKKNESIEHIMKFLSNEYQKTERNSNTNKNQTNLKKTKGYFDIYFRRKHLKA